jgi:hypothetical protein
MDIRIEQQRKDIAIMHEKSVQNMMNQVPFIVNNIFSGMGGVMNVVPLQLKDPASLQPALVLTEGNPTPQGSGSSTCAESTRVGTTSLHYLFGLPNLYKASSFLPPNSAVASKHFAMDVDDIAWSTDDPTVG